MPRGGSTCLAAGLCVIALSFGARCAWPSGLPADGLPPAQLLDADPHAVTWADLQRRLDRVEANYERYHDVYGIVWPAWRNDPDAAEPTYYESGGDSALFTGYYLAAAVYRFLVTERPEDLDQVLDALGGIHLLTHASGTPGVLARCVFPEAEAARFNFPERWQRRIAEGHVYHRPAGLRVPDILHPGQVYPRMIFFTHTSRDQLTGVLFGLGVTQALLHAEGFEDRPDMWRRIRWARDIDRYLIEALWWRLESTEFVIMDHEGRTGTGPPRATGSLRLQLAALHLAVVRESGDQAAYREAAAFYQNVWRKVFAFGRFGNPVDLLNRFNNLDDYFAWNLRFARIYTVWLLETDPKRRTTIRRFVRRKLWSHVQSHRNTYFTFLYNAMEGTDDERMDAAVLGLKELALRSQRMWSSPLIGEDTRPSAFRLLFCDVSDAVVPAHLRQPAQYFQWEKDPFLVGEGTYREGLQVSPMIGLLLPYWLGRYYGFVEEGGTPGN